MFHRIKNFSLKDYLNITSRYDAIKVTIIALCFFIVLGSYTVVRELKDSVFVLIVGYKYMPDIKNLATLLMIPLIFFYSWLVGRVKKHWLIVIYTLLFGIGGLIGAYFLHHPLIGLTNTTASGSRLFGWIFYLFLEGYSPFVVSLLWAYMNSISKPEEIKNRYMLVTVTSKLGGAIGACLAWLFMSKYFTAGQALSETTVHVYIMAIASCALLIIPFLIFYLIYKVPCEYLRGYGDPQPHCKVGNKDDSILPEKSGSGFTLLFKYPYVLGIFGMIFFWETISVIFNYMKIGIGLKEASGSMLAFGAFLYKNAMFAHILALIVTIVGTSSLINLIGERFALMAIPLFIGSAIIMCLFFQSANVVIATYIFIKSINYSFGYPLREGLYIPTTDAIRFKSKSWIDSFGAKIAKAFGSIYNKSIQFVPIMFLHSVQFSFFIIITLLWTALAYSLGKRWAHAVKNGEVIGEKN